MQTVTPLKRILTSEGRTQSWLAREIGMDPAKLNRIVNGLHADVDTRRQIASQRGRKIEEVFPGAPSFKDAA